MVAEKRKKYGFLTPSDVALMQAIERAGVSHVDEVAAGSEKLRLEQVPGNPPFKAQFDVSMIVKYFSVAGGVYTSVLYAALPAALQTQLSAFIFGNSDLSGGFKKSQGQFPLVNWNYDTPFVYGRDYANANYGALDATAKATLQKGDLVQTFYAASGGTNYSAFVILRCPGVAYATLVDSLNSDRFWVNNIRYQLPDTTATGLLQYDNDIKIMAQSLFGLYAENTVSPTSFKQPNQFQNGIIDVPIKQGVDKNVIFGTYINTYSISQKWSIFVREFDRVKA